MNTARNGYVVRVPLVEIQSLERPADSGAPSALPDRMSVVSASIRGCAGIYEVGLGA